MDKWTSKERFFFKAGQKKMTGMLEMIDKMCRENNLKYWCLGGTLIGAIRHKGWIPFDGDVDIGMLEEDYNILKKLKVPDRYWFQDKEIDKNYTVDICKFRYLDAYYIDFSNSKDYYARHWLNGIQVDIFVFRQEKNKIVSTLPLGWQGSDIKTYNKDEILPLKELSFEGINVYVPNKYDKICSEIFGGYPPPMPPIEKQYPNEGRISFTIPDWIKEKYPEFYK